MIYEDSPQVQELVHDLEAGHLKKLILRMTFFAVVGGLAGAYLFLYFRGLNSETAMDQAQIGRQIAAGSGYTTRYVRPMAIWQFLNHKERLPEGLMPDTYNAPLNPLVNAVMLRPIKRWWPMGPTDIVYLGDRVVAAAGVGFFFLAVAVFFFLARTLFDSKIAWMGTCLILLTDLLWQFSVSGLPQMVMLFLFSLALFFCHWAIVARSESRKGRMLSFLAGAALLFGFMALAHSLGAWIFLGFMVFVAAFFRPRSISGLLVLFVFAAVVAPWLVRNYLVCGNPFGLGIYNILDGTTGSEYRFMGSLQPDMTAFGAVRSKLRGGVLDQLENLFGYLGYNVVAAAFFFSLLHMFKREDTNMFRWMVAVMWLFVTLGMALFNPRGPVSANQMHVLFVPVFVFYGLAFLLVLWSRMDLRFPFARAVFLGAVFFASAVPIAVALLTRPMTRVQWPPYVPPFINTVSNWMKPGEIICSDMPWATAWYGGRVSLLLPSSVSSFITIHDYKYLGGPVNGLYLTPISGNRPFLTDIARGDYREWATFIMRTADLSRFPLQYFAPLPIDNECVFYSNVDRWSKPSTP